MNHVFQAFVDQAIDVLRRDTEMLALAVGGSWTTDRMDKFSDLDLVLVSTRPIAPDLSRMCAVAEKLGVMLSAFRGDHVGELRLLIALYDDPLLHVDIKFLTTPECYDRVEDPVVVWERDNILLLSYSSRRLTILGLILRGLRIASGPGYTTPC